MIYVIGDYLNETDDEYDSFVCELIEATNNDTAWWKGKFLMAEYGRNIEWIMEVKDMHEVEHWIKRMEGQIDVN